MRAFVVAYLPWLLSAVTIWMTVLAGNKHRFAWAIGLANQALWLGWIICAEAWGLLPMNVALWAVYTRNHLKWGRSEPKPAAASILSDAFWKTQPLGRPGASDDEVPVWKQVDALFERHGQEPPSGRLRDELVSMALWARWGWRVSRGDR